MISVLPHQAAAGVFDHGEGFGQNFVQLQRQFGVVLDLGKFGLPSGGFGAQVVVGQLLQSGFQLVDLLDARPEFLHFAVVARPKIS